MKTDGSANLFGLHRRGARGLGHVKLAVEHGHGARPPIQRSSSVATLSSDAAERSRMTATEDAYRFECVWIDGNRLPFDA